MKAEQAQVIQNKITFHDFAEVHVAEQEMELNLDWIRS
jgi:hypothetical protein